MEELNYGKEVYCAAQPDVNIAGEYYNKFNTDCVYAWKRGSVWLYVGTSSYGFSRIFKHNVIGKAEEVLDTDEILVWSFSDSFTARLAELEFIVRYKPVYNKVTDVNQLFGSVLAKKRVDRK